MISDEQQIKNLLHRYMEATDDGDFAARAALFEHATVIFPPPIGTLRGAEAAESFRQRQRLYGGIPRTSHLCLNVDLEIDETGTAATCRSRYLVLQETDGFPLQPIITGRYHDRFERVGGRWRFAERRFLIDQIGDMSAHHHADQPSARDMKGHR